MMLLLIHGLGCVTEFGNPEYDVDLAAVARTTAPEQVALGVSTGADVVVEEAFVTLRELRFESGVPCVDGGGPVEGRLEGPWTVDLVVGDVLPVTLTDRVFCRLRLGLDRAEGGLLDDVSVQIRGTAGGTPYVIESRDTPDLDLRAPGGEPFEVTEPIEALSLAFDMARWLPAGLSDLPVGTDGVIRVDDDANDDTLDEFETALEDALELVEDRAGAPLATAR